MCRRKDGGVYIIQNEEIFTAETRYYASIQVRHKVKLKTLLSGSVRISGESGGRICLRLSGQFRFAFLNDLRAIKIRVMRLLAR